MTGIPPEAAQAMAIVRELIGESAIGIYLFGSAVVGGSREHSDVDVLVAVNRSVDFEKRQALIARLLKTSGAIGNPHSIRPLELTVIRIQDVVPWRFPPRAELVYGEWLRGTFESRAVPEPVHDPDLAIVLKKVIDNSLTLWGEAAVDVFDPIPMEDILRAIRESLPTLLKGIDGDERNTVLTLARMWLTAATGDIAPKDIAAQWAALRLPEEQASMLHEARLGYLGTFHDNWRERENALSELIRGMRNAIEACLDSGPVT